MRVIVQRVNYAELTVEDELISKIGKGLIVFVGFDTDPSQSTIEFLANKVSNLRIFQDEDGKMNFSVKDVGGEILVVSNFTLYADCSRGTRPNFCNALVADKAIIAYEKFVDVLKGIMGEKIKTGKFKSHMHIHQECDGPINIIIDRE